MEPSEQPARREALIAARGLVGLSREKLAELVHVDASTVSAWEGGRRTPSPVNRPALAEALGVTPIELARMLGTAPPTDLTGHVVPRDMSHYDSLVLTAGRIDTVEKSAIHGLLQTKGYAEALERITGLSDTDVMTKVDERLTRQAVLYRDEHPAELNIFLPEIVLSEVIGGPEVMTEQVDHVLDLSARSNITVRLLPADGRSTLAANGVELLTKPTGTEPYMAVSFDADGRLRYFAPEEIDRFTALFARLASAALPPDETAQRLDEIRRSFHR